MKRTIDLDEPLCREKNSSQMRGVLTIARLGY
jgi:hypothetical protein